MKHLAGRFRFLSFCLFTLTYCATVSAQSIDSLLILLDKEIDASPQRIRNHEKKISETRQKLGNAKTSSERLRIFEELTSLYFYFQSDSALSYNLKASNEAAKEGNVEKQQLLICQRANILGTCGLVSRAYELLDSLQSVAVSNKVKKKLYCYYYDVTDYFYSLGLPQYLFVQNLEKIRQIKDSFNLYCENTEEKVIHTENANITNIQTIEMLRRKLEVTTNDVDRAVLACVIGNNYHRMWNLEKRNYYWAMAAVHYLRACRMDNQGLIYIAKLMMDEENWSRAEKYMNCAYEQAVFFKGRGREVELAPYINRLYQREQQKSARNMHLIYGLAALALLLAFGCGIFYYYLRKTIRKMRNLDQTHLKNYDSAMKSMEMSQKLTSNQSNAVSHFLTLAIDAIYEFFNLRQIALRKLRAGDEAELKKLLSNGSFFSEKQKELLLKFDIIFTRLYPNFSEKVNSLLEKDKQIPIADDELMSNEIRVMALIRLGINDNLRIATILSLSVNTVYTYHNSIRNKAIDRKNFDKNVMNIT